ncbi:MAG: hypothetical protein OXR84_16360 [Magnetovibrio sp.]|nr:hypothetical protein [Magnetovibrio sp.]
MADPVIAWSILIFGYLLPLAHVAVTPQGGPWRAPEGGRCPFSPRIGWLVLVLLLGPIGWLMFMRGRRRRAAPPDQPSTT